MSSNSHIVDAADLRAIWTIAACGDHQGVSQRAGLSGEAVDWLTQRSDLSLQPRQLMSGRDGAATS